MITGFISQQKNGFYNEAILRLHYCGRVLELHYQQPFAQFTL
ncbi:hypothetical protein PPHE_b0165 [Pseudoalteromonas phenolica O-BC30]|nr:hypothetical protein [Pseudoalteromonas phenolica O-BC30]